MSHEAATGAGFLAQFLGSHDSTESQGLLTRLVWDEAAPIVRSIVGFKIGNETADGRCSDAEDVISDILADLIARLRDMKEANDNQGIHDFRGYVAVMAYHGCNDHFRRK